MRVANRHNECKTVVGPRRLTGNSEHGQIMVHFECKNIKLNCYIECEGVRQSKELIITSSLGLEQLRE